MIILICHVSFMMEDKIYNLKKLEVKYIKLIKKIVKLQLNLILYYIISIISFIYLLQLTSGWY